MIPLYSIIIPHKNCPNLLKRCIDSVPNRSDIQIIAVDDNSNNKEAIKQLEENYSGRNVSFVYTTEGRGAGFARNKGLELATGKWLIFSDSDDFFDEGAFEQFDEYVNVESDMVYFMHRSVFSDTLEPCERYDVRNDLITKYLTRKSHRDELTIRYKDVVPWGKMIRKSLVDEYSIRFDEVPASNDVMFVVQSARHSGSVSVSNSKVYVTTYREDSITRVASKENNFSRYKVSLRFNNIVKEDGFSYLRGRVFSYVFLAFRTYGFREAFRYLREAHRNGQWLFTGGVPGLARIFEKLAARKGVFNG